MMDYSCAMTRYESMCGGKLIGAVNGMRNYFFISKKHIKIIWEGKKKKKNLIVCLICAIRRMHTSVVQLLLYVPIKPNWTSGPQKFYIDVSALPSGAFTRAAGMPFLKPKQIQKKVDSFPPFTGFKNCIKKRHV